jgi:hypothetical protein
MSTRTKYLLVYPLVVLLPLAGTFVNKCYVASDMFFWHWACPRNLIVPLTLIPFAGSAWIVLSNYRTKTHSVAWYVVAGLTTAALGLHLYIIFSLLGHSSGIIFG